MRPRLQSGQVVLRGDKWVLRYRAENTNGTRQKVSHNLANSADHPDLRPTDVTKARARFADKIAKHLAPVNQGHTAVSGASLSEFIEQSYFARLVWRQTVPAGNELHIEPSTISGYRDIFKVHIKNNPVAKINLGAFKPRDGQRFLDSIPQTLSHQTHLRIKNFMRGAFTWAISDGQYDGANPFDELKAGGYTKDSSAPRGDVRIEKIRASNQHAYSLEEVAEMMDKLPEPARTVCAVAAFTGLSRSELRGLKWDDYKDSHIRVTRKVWEGQVGATKTDAREAAVYVVPLLQKILGKYKTEFPPMGDGWIFRGEKLLRPLDLDNLSRRDIPQYINGAWFGWHAFRRGLGTRLYEANVADKDIQMILRHANVSTTMAHYVLPSREKAQAGLKKLGAVAQKRYGIKV